MLNATILIALVLISTIEIGTYFQSQRRPVEQRIGAIVTILPQADFVENVGGDRVRVTTMVPPVASPHTYEPTPSQREEVNRVEIYYKVGSGIEFERAWL